MYPYPIVQLYVHVACNTPTPRSRGPGMAAERPPPPPPPPAFLALRAARGASRHMSYAGKVEQTGARRQRAAAQRVGVACGGAERVSRGVTQPGEHLGRACEATRHGQCHCGPTFACVDGWRGCGRERRAHAAHRSAPQGRPWVTWLRKAREVQAGWMFSSARCALDALVWMLQDRIVGKPGPGDSLSVRTCA